MDAIAKRILVVDDDVPLGECLHMVLSRAGYDAVWVGDGVAALKEWHKRSFDLVITDLIMPEKEGLATIMELRKLSPRVKIIAISGGGRIAPGDYLNLARHLGADAALAKPFSSEAMLAMAAQLLAEATEPAGRPS